MKKVILTVAVLAMTQVGLAQAKKATTKTPAAAPIATTVLTSSSVDDTFKSDVLKVLALNGSAGQIEAAKKQVLGMIPEDKQASFLVEFDGIISKINDATAKVYMEEYTKEDVKAMLAFYESPIGKKINEKSAAVSEKSQEAMQEVTGDVQALMSKYMQ